MSWLPQDKLTTEEKEKFKELQQRKDSLIGKYHTQIKSQTTTHETWLNTFITDNTKKRVQNCKDFHEKKIDKVKLTLDDLQAYAIYSTAINTFKETKDETTKQHNKDLEAIELEIDELAKEINGQIITREQQQQKTDRTKEIQKLKADSDRLGFMVPSLYCRGKGFVAYYRQMYLPIGFAWLCERWYGILLIGCLRLSLGCDTWFTISYANA